MPELGADIANWNVSFAEWESCAAGPDTSAERDTSAECDTSDKFASLVWTFAHLHSERADYRVADTRKGRASTSTITARFHFRTLNLGGNPSGQYRGSYT